MLKNYRITIKETLDDDYRKRFEDWNLFVNDNGSSELTGPAIDQSGLYGVLNLIQRLNLTLISITSEKEENSGE